MKIVIKSENCTGCRICQLRCSYLYNKEFSLEKAYIKVDFTGLEPRIKFDEDCRSCGECADYCLYGALIKEVE